MSTPIWWTASTTDCAHRMAPVGDANDARKCRRPCRSPARRTGGARRGPARVAHVGGSGHLGEQDGGAGARGEAEERRVPLPERLVAGRIEHGHEVADALVHRRRLGDAIREPEPAWVYHDEPREAREPSEEAGRARVLPLVLEVRERPGGEEQVRPLVAHDLVRDRDVPVVRVRGLRPIHSGMVSRPPGAAQDGRTSVGVALAPRVQRVVDERASF